MSHVAIPTARSSHQIQGYAGVFADDLLCGVLHLAVKVFNETDNIQIHASTMNYDPDNIIRVGTDLRFVDSSRPWDKVCAFRTKS